jgi:alpha-L-fucosidase
MDKQSLQKFRELRESIFNKNLAQTAKITVLNIQNRQEEYSPINMIDEDRNTYYLNENNPLSLEIILEFDKMIVFNIISLQEYLPLGQRVDQWLAECWENDLWQEFATGTSIGNKRLWEGRSVTTSKVKITLIGSKTVPAISELGLYFYNEKANKKK